MSGSVRCHRDEARGQTSGFMRHRSIPAQQWYGSLYQRVNGVKSLFTLSAKPLVYLENVAFSALKEEIPPGIPQQHGHHPFRVVTTGMPSISECMVPDIFRVVVLARAFDFLWHFVRERFDQSYLSQRAYRLRTCGHERGTARLRLMEAPMLCLHVWRQCFVRLALHRADVEVLFSRIPSQPPIFYPDFSGAPGGRVKNLQTSQEPDPQ